MRSRARAQVRSVGRPAKYNTLGEYAGRVHPVLTRDQPPGASRALEARDGTRAGSHRRAVVARPIDVGRHGLRLGGGHAPGCDMAGQPLTDLAMAIRLRRARLEAGWDVARAAHVLGTSKARLTALEAGLEPVRASTLLRAARTYGVMPWSLLPEHVDLRLARAVMDLDTSEQAHLARLDGSLPLHPQ